MGNKITTSAFEWAQFIVGTLIFSFMLYANVFVAGVEFGPFWLAIPGALLGSPLRKLLSKDEEKK